MWYRIRITFYDETYIDRIVRNSNDVQSSTSALFYVFSEFVAYDLLHAQVKSVECTGSAFDKEDLERGK